MLSPSAVFLLRLLASSLILIQQAQAFLGMMLQSPAPASSASSSSWGRLPTIRLLASSSRKGASHGIHADATTTTTAATSPTCLFAAGSNSDPPMMTANELFASEGWGPICAELDQLPIFTVANAQGQPMVYQIELKGETFQVPFFYTDVDDALKELAAAKENTKLEGMDIIPFALGKAFVLWASDQAVIVPNKAAVVEAGGPPHINPVGQQVPLFACMDIAQQTPDGKSVLPLFLRPQDAKDALAEAVQADGGSVDEFEIVSLSLNRAVEILATNSESTAFHFIPPASSIQYIQKYLSG